MLKIISIFLFFLTTGLLVRYFIKSDRGAKEPKGALMAAFGFGVLSVVTALWFELFLPSSADINATGLSLFLTGMAIGIIEESAKFIPLALFIWGKDYFNEHTDGVIYFAIVGLTFGLIENLAYLLFYKDATGAGDSIGIFRLIVLFFFHAAATGIAGYYLAKAKIQKMSLWTPAIALIVMIIVHGLYDFLLLYANHLSKTSSYISEGTEAIILISIVSGLILSALLNTFLFLHYGRARQWDLSIGLANENGTINYRGSINDQAPTAPVNQQQNNPNSVPLNTPNESSQDGTKNLNNLTNI